MRSVGTGSLSMIHDTVKHFEVGWKGLACAARVIDAHFSNAAGCQGKSHGHAVVIICVNGC